MVSAWAERGGDGERARIKIPRRRLDPTGQLTPRCYTHYFRCFDRRALRLFWGILCPLLRFLISTSNHMYLLPLKLSLVLINFEFISTIAIALRDSSNLTLVHICFCGIYIYFFKTIRDYFYKNRCNHNSFGSKWKNVMCNIFPSNQKMLSKLGS